MNHKHLMPMLVAPVDRSAATKFVSSFKQDANGIVLSYSFEDYCDWCKKDCEKYRPDNPHSCMLYTCNGNCWSYWRGG